MSDYNKVTNDFTNEQSSVDSLNTNSCSSKNSTTIINETVNSIKNQESNSGFSTPPTVSADTCDSGFTEFFSSKAGTSNTTSRSSSSVERPKNVSDSASIKEKNEFDNYSSSDSDSDSKWKSEEITQAIDDDTSDSNSSSNFRSDESRSEMNRISYRWVEWCHKQLITGVNPRTILRKIFRNSEFTVPPGISDRELWGRIANFVTQSPERTRLKDINSIDHVIGLLKTCKNIIVLTGAGVSVSCGIPDFRSKSGIYQRLRSEIPEIVDPHEIFDIRFFSKDPRPFFKFAKELFPGSFTPSLCHRFIRLLEKKDKLLRNYSQNIDTLERQAGIERVIECHGSFATASCTKCNDVVSSEEIREHVLAQKIPMCGICNPVSGCATASGDKPPKIISHSSSMSDGYKDLYDLGILKPDIVFFGESLPEVFHPAIDADRQKCDLLLVIGSSLKVRPVSLIPEFVRPDVPQILINRERVDNYVFDIELLGDADVIVNQLCCMLDADWTEIAEQPALTLTSTVSFEPNKVETAIKTESGRSSPTNEVTPSLLTGNDNPKSPISHQSTQDTINDGSKVYSKELKVDEKVDDVVTVSSTSQATDAQTCSTQEPTTTCSTSLSQEEEIVKRKVFKFSVENIPAGCYYQSLPNKYVFPGSTHIWYGSGKPDDDDDNSNEEYDTRLDNDDEIVVNFNDDTDDGESEGSLSNQCHSPVASDSSDNDDSSIVRRKLLQVDGEDVQHNEDYDEDYETPRKKQKPSEVNPARLV